MSARAQRRGITLIELVVAMAVMLVAVAAATTLMVAAVRMARDRTGNVEAAERARLASAEMLENLERTGLGSWFQLTVNIGGTAQQIMPIYTLDNQTRSMTGAWGTTTFIADEIWMVTPSRLAMGEPCWDTGAKVPLTAGQAGNNVTVACTAGFANYTGAGHFVMMFSGQGTGKAGLLSSPTISSGSVIASPDGTVVTGFGASDSLVGVQVLHYYIAPNPMDRDPNGAPHPALFRGYGQLTGVASAPFQDAASPGPVPEIPDVEDLEVAAMIDTTGTKDPTQYAFDAGLPPQPTLAFPQVLKSMRVTLVSRSHLASRDGNQASNVNQAFVPLTVENHVSTGIPDGYQRVTFTRRVELPNMGMTSF
jgi:prepilin-type N-terminal cleavage/methylation domain-containing protein